MGSIHLAMIKEAMRKYGKISICPTAKTLSASFTRAENDLLFWFNTQDQTTRIISVSLDIDSSSHASEL